VHSQDGLEPAPTKPFLKFRGGFREIIGAFSKLSRTLEKWGGFREIIGAFSKLSRTRPYYRGIYLALATSITSSNNVPDSSILPISRIVLITESGFKLIESIPNSTKNRAN